jgi:hypothetical protein
MNWWSDKFAPNTTHTYVHSLVISQALFISVSKEIRLSVKWERYFWNIVYFRKPMSSCAAVICNGITRSASPFEINLLQGILDGVDPPSSRLTRWGETHFGDLQLWDDRGIDTCRRPGVRGRGTHLHPPCIFESSPQIKKEHNIKTLIPKMKILFLIILPLRMHYCVQLKYL